MELTRQLHCVLLVFSVVLTLVSAYDPYSEALLSLRSEIIDDSNSLEDWIISHDGKRSPSGKISACSWSGVRCNKNSTAIIGLNLSAKNLGGFLSGKQFSTFTELIDLNVSDNWFSGQLPAGTFNLTNLISLDISRNNFSGHFPGGVSGLRNLVVFDAFSNSFSGPLPAELSKLENLKVLNLAGSYFGGPIPSQYGSFKSLEFLHLAGNLLGGQIPPELGMLGTVTHMEIGYNSYTGSIPWQLGNMSQLQYLDIAGANISGSMPKHLSNLTRLASLFLFRNQISGLIPQGLGTITSLVNLDLSDNHISGPIPESFAGFKNLRLLSLMYNEMSGSIPEGIAQLPSLETLFIWNNFFSGSLPESLGRHSKLRWLDVSTNNFRGYIPQDICSGGMLFKLILFSNNFSGSLSPLSNCSSLVRLRLEDNSFAGSIPLKFSQLSDVSYIDISRNKFTGGIPKDVSEASKLQYLNLSDNPWLGGTIPKDMLSLPLLQNFSASSCGIIGSLPPFKSCESVSVVELHNNNLAGILPRSISNCHTLERMDLAGNNLIGSIPEELASLPVLNFLDLSHNNFSGSIPAKLGKSSSLVLLNISFNDISGSIPSAEAFQSMERSAYAGNPKLCGRPLVSCPAAVAGTKRLIFFLVLSSVTTVFVIASILGVLYMRKRGKGEWKMVSFAGLPQFTASDVIKSFNSSESMEAALQLPTSICNAVLPTGITVMVKKIEWKPNDIGVFSRCITHLGNTRHGNLIRLLGFCYNKQIAYLLYDYLPNGNLAEKTRTKREWATKNRIITGVAQGLCFLHHSCYPAISHGDLKSTNILFDENMEPHLAEFGLKPLMQLSKGSNPSKSSRTEKGLISGIVKEEFYADIYSFGEIIWEILSNSTTIDAGATIQNQAKDSLLRKIYTENNVVSDEALQKELRQVLEVALLCTRSRPSDRPNMEDVLKLLPGSNLKRTQKNT